MNKEKKIIQAPYIDQSIKYPTGCESVSTVMLLQYLGNIYFKFLSIYI